MTPLEIEALLLSLKVAAWAVVVELPIAVALAWVLARKEFPGKILLDGLVHLPLVVPPVAVGYLLLLLLGRRGLVGSWLHDGFGITLTFSWQGAAVAAAVMAFPLMTRAIRLSFETIDRRLETAARTLGASRMDAFLSISLPLAAPGVVTGIVLAFTRCLGEFGATITFVANIAGETRTLPIALYTLLQSPGGEDGAMRLMVISFAVAILALLLSELFSRRWTRRLAGH